MNRMSYLEPQLEPRFFPYGQEMGRTTPVAKSGSCCRKKYPHFLPRRGLYVLHRDFGQVTNIGMGGICFTYFGDLRQQGELPREGLLVASNQQYLDGLPFETMSDDLVVIPHLAGRSQVRRRCIQFGELDDHQVEELERFILDNAYIPQLSSTDSVF